MDGDAVKQLRAAFEDRRPLFESLAVALEASAKHGLAIYEHKHVDRIYFRAKGTESFVGKVAKREADIVAGVLRDGKPLKPYTNPLTQVEDQVAGRVLVFFDHDIDPVVRHLTTTFNQVEMQDKAPHKDAEFGYESMHLVCAIPDDAKPSGWADIPSMPQTFELQVRTLFSHAWAEPQHDLGYKAAGELTKLQRRKLAWIAASAWGADQGLDAMWTELGEGAPIGAEGGRD